MTFFVSVWTVPRPTDWFRQQLTANLLDLFRQQLTANLLSPPHASADPVTLLKRLIGRFNSLPRSSSKEDQAYFAKWKKLIQTRVCDMLAWLSPSSPFPLSSVRCRSVSRVRVAQLHPALAAVGDQIRPNSLWPQCISHGKAAHCANIPESCRRGFP